MRSALTKRKTRINRTAFTIRASRKIRRALKLETGLSGLAAPVLEASHRNIKSSAISQIELTTMKASSKDQSQSSPQKNSRQPCAHSRIKSSNVNMKARLYLMLLVIQARTEGSSQKAKPVACQGTEQHRIQPVWNPAARWHVALQYQ